MRLGFAVKPLGRTEMKSHDTRRWQSRPHLTVSLAYLRDIFGYLVDAHITMYRMSADLAPYLTHPELPQFHTQIEESLTELAFVGALARNNGIRLSMHAGQHVVLSSPEATLAARSATELESLARILESMGTGPECTIITHLGGTYGDREQARACFARNYLALTEGARSRIALENDDSRFDVGDTLWVHERTSCRVVFDYLHHRINNRAGLPTHDALKACLATWPATIQPKIHFSSPRTEWIIVASRADNDPHVRAPQWRKHSDYIDPFAFIDFMREVGDLRSFDVMLEARAKDLALRQLRRDLVRYAPKLAQLVEPPMLADDTMVKERDADENDCRSVGLDGS